MATAALHRTPTHHRRGYRTSGLTTAACEPIHMSGQVSRRAVLRTAAAGIVGGTAAAAETATAQPSFDGWLSGVTNYNGVTDQRGQSEVTVAVGAQGNGGAFAFDPAAVQVDPGTTVTFEWTGEGAQHNVVHEGGDYESELTDEEGFTFQHTFESEGVSKYYCQPHRSLGMKGVVVVGPLQDGGANGGGNGGSDSGGDSGGGAPQVPDTAMTLGVATGVSMVATLSLAYLFLKYGGDYGDAD